MIGSIVLSLALASSLMAMVMYFLTFRGYKNTINYARVAYHVMAMLVITAAALLWYAILTHSWEYRYVYDYSSTQLKTGFLLASFWGGQEGSFTLWLLLTSIIGIVLQSYSSKRGDLEPRVMTAFTLATTFLLIMVSPLFKNPFAYIWSEPIFISAKSISPAFLHASWLQNFTFTDGSSGNVFIKMNQNLHALLSSAGISVNQFIVDGKGLNPQLLNFWMQIHPPILFTGFSMMTVPFAFAMAALMKNDYKNWIRQAFPWVLAGAGILGLGIMLGGYWAYEMLGWGGYWAWDPVENSSLIPWLVGVAAVHTLLVQRKSQNKDGGIGRYARTNLILCILTYVLVLYSTFLTRSGVLGDASVHSFVDPGMLVYLFLIVFIGTFVVVGFGMVAYRWKYFEQHVVKEENIFSRELALFTAAIVLSTSALIILVGTSSPLFGTSVDAFFYNEMHVPIAIIIGLLNGLSLLIKWNQTKGHEIIKKSIPAVSLALLITIVIAAFGQVDDLMMIILIFSTLFALIVNAEIAIRIIRGNMKMLGAYVAHIGIAVFILGVVGSAAYGHETDVDLIKGVPQKVNGYELTFLNYEPIENNTKYAFNINVKKGDKDYVVSPVMYISTFNNGLMREPAILSLMTKDFYISPLGYQDESQNQVQGQTINLGIGEAQEVDGVEVKYLNFDKPDLSVMQNGGDFQMGTKLTVTKNGKTYDIEPLIKRTGRDFKYVPAEIQDANIKVQLKKIDPSTQKAEFIVSKIKEDKPANTQQSSEVLTVAASIKPFVSLVWTGILIMVLGFFVSVARRLKESFVE